MDQETETYEKCKSYSLHGTMYELQLIILFVCKTLKKPKHSFKLATQWSGAEKFDDLVCVLKNEETLECTYRFLQAKHSQTDGNDIEFKMLTNRNKDQFDMQKYFLSFLKISDRFQENEKCKLKDFIIFTNRSMNKSLELRFKDDLVPEDILQFDNIERDDGMKPRRLKMKINECWKDEESKKKFISKLREVYFSYEVAKLIVNCLEADIDLDLTSNLGNYIKEHELIDIPIGKLSKTFLEAPQFQDLRALCFEFYKSKVNGEIKENDMKKLFKEKEIKSVDNQIEQDGNENKDQYINDNNAKQKIDDFFSKFRFYINQPNVKELSKIIKTEINDLIKNEYCTLNALEGYILQWMNETNGKFLTHQTMKRFFQQINIQPSKLISGYFSKKYKDEIKSYKIEFTLESLDNLRLMEFLRNKKSKLLYIQTPHTQLTMCKIQQSLINIADKELEFFDSNALLILKEYWYDIFNKNNTLQVIEFSENKISDKINSIIQELFDENDYSAKIIFIINKANEFRDFAVTNNQQMSLNEEQIEHRDDDHIKMSDLSAQLQEVIWKKTILFQGIEVELKDIVSNTEDARQDIKDDVLWTIINNSMKIGEDIAGLADIEKYFIERQFISNDVKDINDCRNDTKYNFNSGFFDDSEVKVVSNIDDPFIILAGEPGMGKTTIFNYLSWKSKRENPLSWTFKINLNSCVNFLSEQMHYSIENAVQFLIDSSGLKSSLEINLFKEALYEEERKVKLYFDGYDEIDETWRKPLIIILSLMRSKLKIEQIWISTRQHLKNELEDAFSLNGYTLRDLSQEEQVQFLIKFWSSKDDDNESIRSQAWRTIQLIYESIGETEKLIMGIPLHTRMVAEVFEKVTDIPKTIDFFYLYENFIRKKYEIYFYEKMKAGNSSTPTMKLYDDFHEKLSIHLLFGNDETFSGISLLPSSDYPEMAKIGLFRDINADKPEFIHRTFAEYFAGKWFAGNYKSESVRDYLSNNLFKAENKIVRYFFDSILIKNSDNATELHQLVMNVSLSCIKGARPRDDNLMVLYQEINPELLDNLESIDKCDSAGRTVLHLACAYNNFEIIGPLLHKNADSCAFDDLFKWTPLTYACKMEHRRPVEMILKIRSLMESEEKDVIKLVHNLDNPKDEIRFQSFVTQNCIELYKLGIKTLRHNEIDYQVDEKYQQSMQLAVRFCSLDIVKFLIKRHQPTVYWIYEMLLLAVSTRDLEMVKYLISECGDDFFDDKIYLKLLKCAMESKFTNTYEIIEYILKLIKNKEVSLNVIDYEGKVPLLWDSREANFEKYRRKTNLLIENGANEFSDVVRKDFRKRLIVAAEEKRWKMVKYLIEERKVSINTYDLEWRTPLYHAVKTNNLEEIKYLVENGANVEYVINSITFEYLYWNIVKYLIINLKNYDSEEKIKILRLSLEDNNLQLLKISNNSDDLNCKNLKYNGGFVKLKLCESFENYEEFIIEKTDFDFLISDIDLEDIVFDAIFDSKMISGNFYLDEVPVQMFRNIRKHLLHDLVSQVVPKIKRIKEVIENKRVDVNETDCFNRTPLHVMDSKFDQNLMQYLIDKGADVNSKDIEGNTPLHRAVILGNTHNVRLLITHGADTRAINNNRMTILHYAAELRDSEMCSDLFEIQPDLQFEYNVDGYIPLHLFVMEELRRDMLRFTNNVDWITNETINIKTKDGKENSLLLIAVEHHVSKDDVIEDLINLGANVFERNNHHTIIHAALTHSSESTLPIILREMFKCPDKLKRFINAEDQDGYTPLMLAAKTDRPPWPKMKLLIEYGASIDYVNDKGRRVIDFVTGDAYAELCKLSNERDALCIEYENDIPTIWKNILICILICISYVLYWIFKLDLFYYCK